MSRNKTVSILLCLFISANNALAKKSVFIISRHDSPSRVQAYSIEGDQVVYQADVDISTLNPGYGAVGNAIWPEEELMFVTYESSDTLVWSSTKTLEKVGEFDTNILNLAGVVVDTEKELIYIVQRRYESLYVYSFDDVNNTVVLENTHELELSSSYIDPWWGLALDEENDLLYVTDTSKRVHYYDTNDWSLQGYIDITVDSNDRRAVGIAVDPTRGYMYTGAFHGTGGYHQYLVRTELSSPYTSIETYIGQEAIGLAVDEDTGYVYVTTDADDFRVYDLNLTLLDTEENGIYNPAGVAVGGWYKYPVFDIAKDNNDVNCVQPFNEIDDNWLYYNITWDANGYADSNVVIVDYLPKEVDEPNLISDGGLYDANDHTVTWTIGSITGNDSNEFQIRVGVNYWARPGGTITNRVEMEGDEYLSWHIIDTNVCAWGTEIIYVDEDANDPNNFNNGTTWDDAYNLLQEGFAGARNCGAAVTAIWVAAGMHKPVYDMNNSFYKNESFELIKNVGVFGHFGGVGTYETSTSQRDFSDSNNTTILEGQIGENYYEAAQYVVKAQNTGPNSVIDGFTIQNSYVGAGIYLDNSDVAVVNCKLKNNQEIGIHAKNNSSADIHNCIFIDNTDIGIFLYPHPSQTDISYCIFDGNSTTPRGIELDNGSLNVMNSVFKNHTSDGILCFSSDVTIDHSVITNNSGQGLETSGCNLSLENSVIRHSGYYGINLYRNSATTITNNWIHDNGSEGIYFNNPSSVPLVRNNTIYNNSTYGIKLNSGADPNILNCIIWGNTSGDLAGTFNDVNYCSLQTSRGTDNITGDPGFMNVATDPNDLHLAEDSNCVDKGDPNGDYGNETDIDGEDRVCYGRVDIGADEYYWPKADYNRDEIVNFSDYRWLANEWLDVNDSISLDSDSDVDIDDLDLFCADWLWQSAWGQTPLPLRGGGGTDGSLMLPDAKASLAAMPERLAAKTRKFYDLTPDKTITALRKAQEAKRQRIDKAKHRQIDEVKKDILEWLDEIWINGEIHWTEEKYLEFRKSVEDSLQ